MTNQIRLAPDIADLVDGHRDDQSRAAFVNDVLRECFDEWSRTESVGHDPIPTARPTSHGISVARRSPKRIRPATRF